MIDYLTIATGAAQDMEAAPQALALLPQDEAFLEAYRDGCAMDIQAAIDNAFRVGQLGVQSEQVEMFRRAA